MTTSNRAKTEGVFNLHHPVLANPWTSSHEHFMGLERQLMLKQNR